MTALPEGTTCGRHGDPTESGRCATCDAESWTCPDCGERQYGDRCRTCALSVRPDPEPELCGAIRPGTLGYQLCRRPRGHDPETGHRSQDGGEWDYEPEPAHVAEPEHLAIIGHDRHMVDQAAKWAHRELASRYRATKRAETPRGASFEVLTPSGHVLLVTVELDRLVDPDDPTRQHHGDCTCPTTETIEEHDVDCPVAMAGGGPT